MQLLKLAVGALKKNLGIIVTHVALLAVALLLLTGIAASAGASMMASKHYDLPALPQNATTMPYTNMEDMEDSCHAHYSYTPATFFIGFMYIWVQVLLFEMSVHSVAGAVG
eukprot:SAG22_NODE_3437_length_1711_cov_2.285183_1_plen_110_part_10